MKRFYVLSLLVILALVLTPLAAFAQDDEEWQTYTSEDDKLTVSYPPGWVAQEPGEDFPFAGVFLASSEDTMEKLDSEEEIPPASGDVGVIVLLMPMEFLNMMGAELPEDVSTEELTTILTNMFTSPEGDEGEESVEGEQATPEATAEGTEATEEPMEITELGEYEEVDLGEGVMAGLITTATAEDEGAIIVRETQDGVALVVVGLTFPEEYNEELRDIFTRIAGSVQYTGTAEELMNTMMAPPDVETTTLDGETLINERCTSCHTRERIDQADKDEAGWTETVDRMIAYGTVLSAEERDALIQYLVETH